MGENNARQTNGKSLFRVVVAGATAAMLLGSSFYAAQAGNSGVYGDDGDLDGAEVAAISLGAAAGLFFLIPAITRDRDNDDNANAEKAKSASAGGKVVGVRAVPSQNSLRAGDAATVDVQVRYEGSNSWKSVSGDNAASVRLVSGGNQVVAVDGAKNAFALPYGSQVTPGTVTVEASYAGVSNTANIAIN